MLTVEGLGTPVAGCDCGLGKYMLGDDFRCFRDGSLYICKAKGINWAATVAGFKALQTAVRIISAQMSATGTLSVPARLSTLPVDGQLGNVTAIGVLFIGAAFTAAVAPTDPEVSFALKSTDDGQVDIEKIATYAKEITAYFDYVVTNHPEALNPPPEIVEKVVEVEKIIEKEFGTRFRPIGAVVIGAALLAALGLTAASVYYMRRPSDDYGDY